MFGLLLAVPSLAQVTITVSSDVAGYLPRYRNKLRIRITPGPDTRLLEHTVHLALNNVSQFEGINGNTRLPADTPQVHGDDYVFLKSDQPGGLRDHIRIDTFPARVERIERPDQLLRPVVTKFAAQRDVEAGQILHILPSAFAGTGTIFDLGGPVDVFLTSLDHGGFCQVVVIEEETVVAVIDVPVDSDRDLLPDLWEQRVAGNLTRLRGDTDDEQFFNQKILGTIDGYPGPGDGLKAFEEYRGFTIQGKARRLDEVTDLFTATTSARRGGPMRMDLFLLDDKEGVGTVGSYIRANRVWGPWIDELGVDPCVIVVRPSEAFRTRSDWPLKRILREPSLSAVQPSGVINGGTPLRARPLPLFALNPLRYTYQAPIELRNVHRPAYAIHVRIGTFKPDGIIGIAFTLEWHSPAPILIDTQEQKEEIAEFLGKLLEDVEAKEKETLRRARVWTLTHEMGHRLGLPHFTDAPSLRAGAIPITTSGTFSTLPPIGHAAQLVPGVVNGVGTTRRAQIGADVFPTGLKVLFLEQVVKVDLLDPRTGLLRGVALSDTSRARLPVQGAAVVEGANLGWRRENSAAIQGGQELIQAAVDRAVIRAPW